MIEDVAIFAKDPTKRGITIAAKKGIPKFLKGMKRAGAPTPFRKIATIVPKTKFLFDM